MEGIRGFAYFGDGFYVAPAGRLYPILFVGWPVRTSRLVGTNRRVGICGRFTDRGIFLSAVRRQVGFYPIAVKADSSRRVVLRYYADLLWHRPFRLYVICFQYGPWLDPEPLFLDLF